MTTCRTGWSKLGVPPAYVLVVGANAQAEPVHRFVGLVGDASLLTDTPGVVTNRILSLEPTGFRIGNDADVNQQNASYHYVAVHQSAMQAAVGAYVGTGADGDFVQTGLQPKVALVQGETQKGVFRPDTVPDGQDLTLAIENVPPLTGAITALQPNGFEVGSNPHVNTPGVAYYWLAFGTASHQTEESTLTADFPRTQASPTTTAEAATTQERGSTPAQRRTLA